MVSFWDGQLCGVALSAGFEPRGVGGDCGGPGSLLWLLRKVGPIPPACLASRFDGRSHAGFFSFACRHHGGGRGLHVDSSSTHPGAELCDHDDYRMGGWSDDASARIDCLPTERYEKNLGLLHSFGDRLYGHGGWARSDWTSDVPPDYPCFF